jgi:hypothetical protein
VAPNSRSFLKRLEPVGAGHHSLSPLLLFSETFVGLLTGPCFYLQFRTLVSVVHSPSVEYSSSTKNYRRPISTSVKSRRVSCIMRNHCPFLSWFEKGIQQNLPMLLWTDMNHRARGQFIVAFGIGHRTI